MTKIWRVWLKNWVCHALLNFKIKMGVAGSIFELHPPNFVKIHIFWISTNDSKTIFCWLCWHRIWKKDDPVLRPGVKESMVYSKTPTWWKKLRLWKNNLHPPIFAAIKWSMHEREIAQISSLSFSGRFCASLLELCVMKNLYQ